MAQSVSDDRRYLDSDEFTLVQETRQLSVRQIDDTALRDLVRRLRERRNGARDIASRQRREMRGKAASAGARMAGDDMGTRRKLDILSAAVKRANKEFSRRLVRNARSELATSARKALAMKRETADGQSMPAYQTPGDGMSAQADHNGRSNDNINEGSFVPQLRQSRGDR